MIVVILILWTVLGIITLGYIQGDDLVDIRECSFPAQVFLVIVGGPISITVFLFGGVIGLILIITDILNGERK